MSKAVAVDLQQDTIFTAVILSCWDHVVGPRIVQVVVQPIPKLIADLERRPVRSRAQFHGRLPAPSKFFLLLIIINSIVGVTVHAFG